MTIYSVAAFRFTDEASYRKYQSQFTAIARRHACTVLVADETPKLLEGRQPINKLVILEFPDQDSATAFATDPEYRRISKLRQAGTSGNVWQVEGLSANGAYHAQSPE